MKPLPLKLLSLLLLLFVFLLLCSSPSPLALIRSSAPTKVPFRSSDLLPLLPWRLARPILRSLRSAVDLLPSFVGAASSPDDSVEWKGACFYENKAWLEYHNESGSPFGGATLHIKTSNAHSWTCMDLYVFATPYRVTWDYYLLSREHTLDFKELEGEVEYEYNVGVDIHLLLSK